MSYQYTVSQGYNNKDMNEFEQYGFMPQLSKDKNHSKIYTSTNKSKSDKDNNNPPEQLDKESNANSDDSGGNLEIKQHRQTMMREDKENTLNKMGSQEMYDVEMKKLGIGFKNNNNNQFNTSDETPDKTVDYK